MDVLYRLPTASFRAGPKEEHRHKTKLIFFIFRAASVLVYSGQPLADMGIIPTGHCKLGQLLSYFLYLSDSIFAEK